MRTIMALAAAAAVTSSPVAQAQTPPLTLSQWAQANIQQNGWEYGSEGTTLLVYREDYKGKDAAQTRRQWERYEYVTPQNSPYGAYKSAVLLTEYSCHGKYRSLSQTLYEGNNAESPLSTQTLNNTAWEYVLPGSISEAMEAHACAPSLAKMLLTPREQREWDRLAK